MINIVMNHVRLLALQQKDPQPRRHKCNRCSKVFVCGRCTKVMRTENKSYDYGLTHYLCRSPSSNTAKVVDQGFLCQKCR